MDMSTAKKLAYRWMGPYCMRSAIPEKGTYKLEKFDGTLIPGTHLGNRLKKFVKREGFYIPVDTKDEEEGESEAEGEGAEEMGDTDEEMSEATLQPKTFEIVLLELTAEQ